MKTQNEMQKLRENHLDFSEMNAVKGGYHDADLAQTDSDPSAQSSLEVLLNIWGITISPSGPC